MHDALTEAAIKTATYIHDRGHTGIILSGNTNKISETLLRGAWEKLYTAEPVPEIFSFNKEENALFYKNEIADSERLDKSRELIEHKFPTLLDNNQKLCYVDELIHTGEKYTKLKTLFEKLGLPKVEFAFLSSLESSEWDRDVFVASKNNEVAGELQRLSLESYGFPTTAESIEKNGTPEHQEEIKQKLDEKLLELGNHIKRQ